MMLLLLRPDGQAAVWCHSLDDVSGTEYSDWIDCTLMGDEEFHSVVFNAQKGLNGNHTQHIANSSDELAWP
jgi:hypothetical protein